MFLLYKICLEPPPRRVSFCAVVGERKEKETVTFFVVSLLVDLLINSALLALHLCGDGLNLFTGIWCGNKLAQCNEHTWTHTYTNK